MSEEIKIIIVSGLIGFVSFLMINWFCRKNKIGLKKSRLEIEEEMFKTK